MDRKNTKLKLQEGLKNIPGYVDKIHVELSNVKGLSIGRSTVHNCLNPKKTTWNNDVIEAATDLVTSQREKEESLHEKVSSL